MGLFTTTDLAELRAFSGSVHTGECVITRYGERELDEDTLVDTAGSGTMVYTGPFELRESDQAMEIPVGEGRLALQMLDVYVDWDAERIRRNDVLTITDAGEDGHTWMVGRDMLVLDQRVQTQARNRKLVCQFIEAGDDLDPTT